MSVLLDSVILIDHLNGVRAATLYLESLKKAHISVITRAEVLAGLRLSEMPAVKEWLDRYPTLAIDRQTADLAADLRRTHKWKLPDLFRRPWLSSTVCSSQRAIQKIFRRDNIRLYWFPTR